jgi:hypothetical protein
MARPVIELEVREPTGLSLGVHDIFLIRQKVFEGEFHAGCEYLDPEAGWQPLSSHPAFEEVFWLTGAKGSGAGAGEGTGAGLPGGGGAGASAGGGGGGDAVRRARFGGWKSGAAAGGAGGGRPAGRGGGLAGGKSDGASKLSGILGKLFGKKG